MTPDPLHVQFRKALHRVRRGNLSHPQLERLYSACVDGFLIEPYRQSNATYNHWYRTCKAMGHPFAIATRSHLRGWWNIKIDTITSNPANPDILYENVKEGDLYRAYHRLYERITGESWGASG